MCCPKTETKALIYLVASFLLLILVTAIPAAWAV